MNFGMLNLLSLLFGLIACGLPTACLLRLKYRVVLTIASFAACILALLMQLLYQWHLVAIRDWSAMMDVTGVMVIVSALLAVATIVLNCICAIRTRREKHAALELSYDGTTEKNSHI